MSAFNFLLRNRSCHRYWLLYGAALVNLGSFAERSGDTNYSPEDREAANYNLDTNAKPEALDRGARVLKPLRPKPKRVRKVDRIPARVPVQIHPPREPNRVLLREPTDRNIIASVPPVQQSVRTVILDRLPRSR